MKQVLPTVVNPNTPELDVFIQGALAIKQNDHDTKFPQVWLAGYTNVFTNAAVPAHWSPRTVYDLRLDWGPKYVKVWAWESRECDDPADVQEPRCTYIYAFIDRMTGDVLKPAGRNAPAKHARSNIFDETNGLSGVDWYGPIYLR
jgi:hypothetical protein